jgi:redox-sensitive bicupin YhaK (pirin superfamily)
LYIFVLNGSIEADGSKLDKKDAIALEELESIDVKANENSELLLIEVPMQ